VNVVSETQFMFKAQGVYAVFRTTVEMLRQCPDVELHVNSLVPCDILHAHFPGPFYFALRPFYGGRSVLSAHVVPESFSQGIVGYKRFEPLFAGFVVKTFNTANLLIAVSPAVKRNLEARGVTAPQVFIPNPIDRVLFRPDPALRARGRALLGIPEGRKLVLGVGLTVLRKGVDEFVETARANPDVTFVWVGGNSFSVLTEGYFRLHDLVSSAPPNLGFPGLFAMETMPELYNAADLLLFPTRQDNFPMVVVEAAACGLPMIIRDLPDFREIFAPAYLPADGVAGFSAAIRRVFGEPALAASLRERSRELAARYDMPGVAARLVECYRSLLTTTGGKPAAGAS
jgi:1,2-diacylglycerol-3-alpha-glucose alpha-1,2-galactosyltransferase